LQYSGKPDDFEKSVPTRISKGLCGIIPPTIIRECVKKQRQSNFFDFIINIIIYHKPHAGLRVFINGRNQEFVARKN